MKKILIILFAITFLLFGCSKTCEHKDENNDSLCDECGKKIEIECTMHIDENKDDVCDKCGDSLDVECASHVDENKDNLCDICNSEIESNFTFDYDAYNLEFEERKAFLREYMTSSKNNTASAKTGFGISALKIAIYEETKDEAMLENALAQANKCYDDFAKNQNCFSVFAASYHYAKYNKYYSEELLNKAKNLFINSNIYSDRPDTPNHTFMYAVATYLVNQEFGDEITTDYYGYVDTLYPEGYDEDAAITVGKIIDNYITSGEYECNSDTYMVSHIHPLLAIRECAKDEELAKKAEMVLHNMILSLSPVWLEGHLAIARDRCYEPFSTQNTGGCLNTLLWYYFGGRSEYPSLTQLQLSESTMIGFALASDFHPHWMALQISGDRKDVYNHYELHEYDYYSFNNEYNYSYFAYMQSYMHQDYSVYSSVWTCEDVTKSGEDRYLPIDRRYVGFDRTIWGIDWVSEDPNQKSNFSIMNWDKVFSDSHMQIGGTCYSEVMQNNGTVMGVFDIPTEIIDYPDNGGVTHYDIPKHLTINMPTNYVAIINEAYLGRMYVHFGTFIIAFQLSVPFVYQNEAQTITSDVTKAYFVCEVVDVDDVEGDSPEEELLYLQSMLEGKFRNIDFDTTGKPKITYTSIEEAKLSLQYGGSEVYAQSYINDVKVEYVPEKWPSQKNPWCNVTYDSRQIVYTYKNHTIKFDFDTLEIIEQ